MPRAQAASMSANPSPSPSPRPKKPGAGPIPPEVPQPRMRRETGGVGGLGQARPTLPAGEERRFRYLADEEVGSHDVTQFLGEIDPSRAPDHAHVYDEVIYVVEGEGTLHLDGKQTPIGPGSCIHLPPRVEHCLENHGPGTMRVLGVFHPAGDPAGRA